MVWLKRNLILVIGGVVAVVLLAGAVVFAQGEKQKEADANSALSQYTNTVNSLRNARPFPNPATINKFEEEAEVIRAFSTNAESLFEYQLPGRMSGQQFKIHLLKSLVQLQADATNNNVEIPNQYQFTFGHLVPMPNLLPYSIAPLQERLDDIQHLCRTLYQSKIHALERMERFPAYPREPGRGVLTYEYWPRTNLTTTDAVFKSTPYVFQFRGFTSELTEVLNNLASADRFYVVRKVDVSHAVGASRPGMMGGGGEMGMDGDGEGASQLAAPVRQMTLAERMARLQMQARMRAQGQAAGAPPELRTVVDEKPLRVTMVVDVVKLVRTKKEDPGMGAPGGPGGPGMPGM